MGYGGYLHRLSDRGIARSIDINLLSWDYRDFHQVQMVSLGSSIVSFELFLRAPMVAHPKAHERAAIGNPTWIEQPGLKLTATGSQFTICATATTALKPTTRIAGAIGQSIFHSFGRADFFLTNWGLSFASHPIVSFQFGDNTHIAFSIEARYRPGQAYSTLLGSFRQFGLIFIVADERDLIRLRTNYRKDEEVYMYRLESNRKTHARMFLTYVNYLNKLNEHPEWYNELTRNCTTTLDKQLTAVTFTTLSPGATSTW